MLQGILQRSLKRVTTNGSAQNAHFPESLADGHIRITPAAAERMQALMAAAQDDELTAIRVFVMGGGCGGMTYSMTYAERITSLDAVLEGDGYRIVVDAIALNYLSGCTIDYAKQGLNESFVFRDVFQSVGGSGGCQGCAASGSGAY